MLLLSVGMKPTITMTARDRQTELDRLLESLLRNAISFNAPANTPDTLFAKDLDPVSFFGL
ncbi:MAG: hypothetical protein ACK4VP_03370 [Nitrospira sp.]